MIYIKLDRSMNLSVTVNEPIYRGDNLNRKLIFLTPLELGGEDLAASYVYLSYIRADGTADITLLTRMEEKYNEKYYQYVLPVTSAITRYTGDVCMWLQIYSGAASSPVISKSGECVIHILASTNMDEYICDRNLSLIYAMQRDMEEKIAEAERALGSRIDETNETIMNSLAGKADHVVFDEYTGALQLMCGENPVGDMIYIKTKGDESRLIGADINDNGELVVTFSDGYTKSLGVVAGQNGLIYVPHIDDKKVLTFTIEAEPEALPGPIDLCPSDDWGSIADGETEEEEAGNGGTDYMWEDME